MPRPRRIWARGLSLRTALAALTALATLAACTSASGHPARSHGKHSDSSTPVGPAVVAPTGPTTYAMTACPTATVTVHDAAGLTAALAAAKPGDVIDVAAGTYAGRFTGTAVGTASKPIFLCGAGGATIDAGSVTGGYGFHLDHAAYWRLTGLTVVDAQKGVVLDATTHTVLDSLTVAHIGDEAIHLRRGSSDDVVVRNTIADTGKRRDKFGEGVYVGTAKSNWCTYTNCQPDPSNHDLVLANHIADTTAESVDIKEGTSQGVVAYNTFDGSALTGADSWVDVKGNGWLIFANVGRHSPQDGFQTHQIVDGDGVGNVFARNIANVDGPGDGFHLTPIASNVVRCDNVVSGAAKGLTNATCVK